MTGWRQKERFTKERNDGQILWGDRWPRARGTRRTFSKRATLGISTDWRPPSPAICQNRRGACHSSLYCAIVNVGEVKEGERKKKRGWTEGSPKERQRNAGSTAILSLPYRRASSPWHNLGPPASTACVNLNRERLRGDSPRWAAILYQNVDKGSQWSTPAPACTSLAIYDPSSNRRPLHSVFLLIASRISLLEFDSSLLPLFSALNLTYSLLMNFVRLAHHIEILFVISTWQLVIYTWKRINLFKHLFQTFEILKTLRSTAYLILKMSWT